MSIEPTKLAGCPFCGSAAELVLNDEKEPDLWLVSCRGCIASIEEVGKSSAIAAWNRRSHPVLPDREGFAAALRWAMDEIDVLSNKLSGFAYPQGMVYARRSGTELQNYAKAVEARRSLAASPATGEREPSRAADTAGDAEAEEAAFEKWAATVWTTSSPPQAAWTGWCGRAGLYPHAVGRTRP